MSFLKPAPPKSGLMAGSVRRSIRLLNNSRDLRDARYDTLEAELWDTKAHSDAVVVSHGNEIDVHKAIVCLRSDYLRAGLSGSVGGLHKDRVDVDDEFTYLEVRCMLEFCYTNRLENEDNFTLADCVTLLRLGEFFIAQDLEIYAERLLWHKLTPYLRKASTVHCYPSSVTNVQGRDTYDRVSHPARQLVSDAIFVAEFRQAVELAYADGRKSQVVATGSTPFAAAATAGASSSSASATQFTMGGGHIPQPTSCCPAAQVILADFTFAVCGALLGTELLKELNKRIPLFGSDVLGVMSSGFQSHFWRTQQFCYDAPPFFPVGISTASADGAQDGQGQGQQQNGGGSNIINNNNVPPPPASFFQPSSSNGTTSLTNSFQDLEGITHTYPNPHLPQQHRLMLSDFGVSSKKCCSCKRNWRHDWPPLLYDVQSLELRPARAVCFACVSVKGNLPGWQPWKK